MSKSNYKQSKKIETKYLTDKEIQDFRKCYSNSVILNTIKTNNALQYLILLNGYTQKDISDILGENKEIVTKWFSKSTKQNIKTLKKRKINDKVYVANLERILDVPKKYWLDDRNLTRDLTRELKREIDLYLLKKYEEVNDTVTYKMNKAFLLNNKYIQEGKDSEITINTYPYEDMIIQIKTAMLKEDIEYIISDIIYTDCENPYDSFNSAALLSQLLNDVRRIDIFNLQKLIQKLTEYQLKEKEQTTMTFEEYESLFGKYKNTEAPE